MEIVEKKYTKKHSKTTGRPITFFEDPKHYTLEHPLQATWCYYYKFKNNTSEWMDDMDKCFTFNTLENFAKMLNNVCEASDLMHTQFFLMFREGVQPMWEDATNRAGAKLELNTDENNVSSIWDKTIICCISGQFGKYANQITGCIVGNKRSSFKVSIWIKDSHPEIAAELIRQWKEAISFTGTIACLSHLEVSRSYSNHTKRR